MQTNFVLLNCLVSISVIAFVHFKLMAGLRRDDFRSSIRDVRDRLFDFMMEHDYSFDAPEYRETRQMLNGILRISNSLGPITFFLYGMNHFERGDLQRFIKRDAQSPPDFLAKRLQEARHEALTALVRFVFCTGLLGFSLRVIVNTLWGVTKVKRIALAIGAVAYRAGSPELSDNDLSRMVGHRC